MSLTKVAPAGIGSTPGDGYRIGSSFLHSTGVELTNANASGIVTAAQFDGKLNIGIATFTDDVKFTGATSGRDVLWDKSNDYLRVNDNARIVFGNSGDLSIRHLSSDNKSYVSSTTNDVVHEFNKTKSWSLLTTAAEKRIVCPAESTDKSVELYWNGVKKLATTNTGASVTGQLDVGNVNSTGVITATKFVGDIAVGSSITYADNEKAYFGTGLDLEIYHNSSNSLIENTNGNLIIKDTTGSIYLQSTQVVIQDDTTNESIAKFISDGACELYWDDAKKFETTQYGAKISTNLSAGYLEVSTTANLGDGHIEVIGGESGGAVFSLTADEGDDNADRWRIQNAGDSKLGFRSKESGSWVEKLGIANNGDATFAGNLVLPDSIIHSGDTDTKIRFPAANTITAETGGTKRLEIDSSGNVLINATTTFAAATKLQVRGASSAISDGGQIFDVSTTATATGGTRLAIGIDEDNFTWIRSYESGVGSRDMILAGSAERLRITSDGDICINQSGVIDNAKLSIKCDATEPAIAVQCNHTNTDTKLISAWNSGGKNIVNITAESDNSPYVKFEIVSGSTPVERFRVNHLGNVSIGGGTAPNRLEIIDDPAGFPSDSAQPNASLLIKHGTSGSNRRWVGIGASLTGAWLQSSSPGGSGLAAPFWINKGGGDVTLGNSKFIVKSGGNVEVGSAGNYGSSPGKLSVGSRATDPGGVTLAIARGEAIGGGTGPTLQFVHGPDGGTQRTHNIYSYVGDLRIAADSNENMELHTGGACKAKLTNTGRFQLFDGTANYIESADFRLTTTENPSDHQGDDLQLTARYNTNPSLISAANTGTGNGTRITFTKACYVLVCMSQDADGNTDAGYWSVTLKRDNSIIGYHLMRKSTHWDMFSFQQATYVAANSYLTINWNGTSGWTSADSSSWSHYTFMVWENR